MEWLDEQEKSSLKPPIPFDNLAFALGFWRFGGGSFRVYVGFLIFFFLFNKGGFYFGSALQLFNPVYL